MPTATVFTSPAEDKEVLSGADTSELGQRAWRGLLRTHSCLAKRLDAELEQSHHLPMSSYEVLSNLAAEEVQLSRSGLTRLVDRLEREELIERCSCDHDARGSYACLTTLGRERLSEARETHLRVVKEHFLSRFSEDELSVLADMWERIAPCSSAC